MCKGQRGGLGVGCEILYLQLLAGGKAEMVYN